MDFFEEASSVFTKQYATRACDWEHAKQERELQEEETLGAEDNDNVQITRAQKHSMQSRVPGVRVKGLKTPYIIIRGRKGKKGEKVVVLKAGQEWTDQEPPITVHSETDHELNDSDTDRAPRFQRQRVQTYKQLQRRRSKILYSDSEDDCGLENSIPTVRDGGYMLDQRVIRGGETDGFALQDNDGTSAVTDHERDKRKSVPTEMQSNSNTAEGEHAERTALKTKDSTDKAGVIREGGKPLLQEKGKDPLHTAAVLIQCDSDFEDEHDYGKTRRYSRADSEDSDVNSLPSRSKRNGAHIVEPGMNTDSGKAADPSQSDRKFHNDDGEIEHILSLDPRTRVNQLREMFHERRRFYNVEEVSRVRLAGGGNEITRGRSDLKAFTYIHERVARLKGYVIERIVGEVPGTEVGDYFFYRIELFVVGLHRQVQAGIDFIPGTARNHKYCDTNGAPMSVALSVVSSKSKSGGYKNIHQGKTLIYTGQGGDNSADQKMVRGNLALKNSCDLGLSIRVVRGVEVAKGEAPIRLEGCPGPCSPSGFVYIYDGLYRVQNYYQDIGPRGFKIWKFDLVRQPDQKDTTDHFMRLG